MSVSNFQKLGVSFAVLAFIFVFSMYGIAAKHFMFESMWCFLWPLKEDKDKDGATSNFM
jgi:Na+/H+-dicarboxylate symporter